MISRGARTGTTYATSRAPVGLSFATTMASRTSDCAEQLGFDFAQLDASAADLHLMIDAPEIFELAVGAPADEVAGAIEALACAAAGCAMKRSAVSAARPR